MDSFNQSDAYSRVKERESDDIKMQIIEAMNLIPLTLGQIQNKEKSLKELPKNSQESEALKYELRQLIREDATSFYTLVKWALEIGYPYLSGEQQDECIIYLLALDTSDYTWLETIPIMNRYCRYSLKILKDSNLGELGKKSRVEEILARVNLTQDALNTEKKI